MFKIGFLGPSSLPFFTVLSQIHGFDPIPPATPNDVDFALTPPPFLKHSIIYGQSLVQKLISVNFKFLSLLSLLEISQFSIKVSPSIKYQSFPTFSFFPFQIKSFIYTFCLCLSWVFAFIILKYFETLVELIGMSGLMLTFSINCLIGGTFVIICVPETKGKSFPEILKMLE